MSGYVCSGRSKGESKGKSKGEDKDESKGRMGCWRDGGSKLIRVVTHVSMCAYTAIHLSCGRYTCSNLA